MSASAQVDSLIGQVTSSAVAESFAGGISGDGRFVVFESTGDHATYRGPNNEVNNADGNREIFLFDYAQRRIFQITNTKSYLKDTTKIATTDNIRVNIVNLRPVISRQPDDNGNYWIAFSSNATTSTPTSVNNTNPGGFDGNAFTTGTGTGATNPLTTNGNTEIWLYRVPTFTAVADLSQGTEIPLNVLSGGAFTLVTNTLPSRLPVAGTTTTTPIIADDNHDSSIDDKGNAISFTSNRDIVPCPTTSTATCGNAAPNFDNDEIYSYVRSSGTLTQLSATSRGSIGNPIYNANSTITNLAGGGWRVVFLSNANNPIPGMTGSNSDTNEEIFYLDLNADGSLGTTRRQVTTTTRTNPGDVVNVLNYGRRMSRDGRYIAFDSYADLANEHGGANQAGFATFVFDAEAATNPFRRILARSNADSGASGGDVQRYPSFTTDFDSSGNAQTAVVLSTRMNIKADGTIPTTSSEGLNDVAARPAQVYSFLLNVSTGADAAKFVRLTKLPTPLFFLASIQPLTTDFRKRISFNLSQTEVGTGNPDLASEVYYFLVPTATAQSTVALNNFSTGASRLPITPQPDPSVTPSPTPTPTPTPSPSPTPQTPTSVVGVSPGLLTYLDYNSGLATPAPMTAVGSIERRFNLPIELGGVTVSVNGVAAGIKSVSQNQVLFVVPPAITATEAGSVYPIVVNNNGTVFKGFISVRPARPDIFTFLSEPGPGGRARVFNSVNRILTREPFTIRTFKLRGSRLVPAVLRVYMTGIQPGTNIAAASFTLRIGSTAISPANAAPVLFEPGVYTVDFTLPSTLDGAGDQPIVVEVNVNGVIYSTRLADTAPRIFII